MSRARDIANLIGGATPDIILKTSDGAILELQTSDTTVTDGSVLGKINFTAPDEASGTDALLVGASIEAVAEGTFAADNNATELVFKTGASEAAAERMKIGSDGKVTITVAGNSDALTVSSTDADSSIGPILRLDRRSSSPADDDIVGAINWTAINDNSEDVMFAQVYLTSPDVSDGTEDGQMHIDTMVAGTSRSRIKLMPGSTVVNENSIDLDFRIESNGREDAFFVDGGTDAVLIGESVSHETISGGTPAFQVSGEGFRGGMAVVRNDTGVYGPFVALVKSRNSSPGNFTVLNSGDSCGGINWFADDGTNLDSQVASIEAVMDAGASENDTPGRLVFKTTADGAAATTEHMRISSAGNVGIGSTLPSASYKFQAQSTANQIVALTYNSNASFTQDLHAWDTNKAGNTNFNFFRARTNVGGSPDSEMILSGVGGFAIDGTVTENGADYAEYFEWKDENSDSEDRVGITVKLDGDKIVPSTSDDNASVIIGVISGKPSVVGDAAWNKWKNKHETDDYGRYVWEEYTFTEWTIPATDTEDAVHHSYPTDYIPSDLTAPSDATVISKDGDGNKLMRRKLNSSYNASATYIPRADRKEWDAVGMMGKLRIRKGQTTGDRWIKMRDVSSSIEEWLVR